MTHKIKACLFLMSLIFLLLCRGTKANTLTPQEIAKKAKAATVLLVAFDDNGKRLARGSGFFVRGNLIATNFHVIEGAAQVRANIVDQKRVYPVERIRGVDEKKDLAILQVSAPGVKPLHLGDSDAVEVGEEVYVVSNPLGLEGSFADGRISAIREQVPWGTGKRIQYTAPTSKGSSGGPAFNNKGEVIGVHVEGLKYLLGENLNFAIPSNYLKALIVDRRLENVLTPQQIYKKALYATVHVAKLDANGDIGVTGSGFFVRPNLIATNWHVIEGATAARLMAKLVGQNRVYSIGRICAVDEKHDLAILQVSIPGVDSLPLGDSDVVEFGDRVYTTDNPRGLEGMFSDGIIIQITGEGAEKLLQFTTLISIGNSGGAVLNEEGRVIGVVSFKSGDRRNNDNYAVPSNTLKTLLSQFEGVKPFFFDR